MKENSSQTTNSRQKRNLIKQTEILQGLFFLHISSSHAKILGETNFHTREIPRSGSKAEDEERVKVNYYNGQYLSPEPIMCVLSTEEDDLLDNEVCKCEVGG